MYVIIYLIGALGLVRYCLSPSHRIKTHARWKQTPTYKIVYEIGGAILGLVILAALIFLLLVNTIGSRPG